MSKHILFLNAVLSARYDSDIHGDNIPAEAIQVTNDVFFKTINEQDGIWQLDKGKVVKKPLPVVEPVDPRKFIEVSAFQAHAAIARSGLYSAVTALMTNPLTPVETALAWNKALTFKRLSPTVLAMAAALELDDAELDALFELAATIEA